MRSKDDWMNKFYTAYQTDIGLKKKSNQDSILLKGIGNATEEILLAIICDGMGGMSKGELASATTVQAFSKWLTEEFVKRGRDWAAEEIENQWRAVLNAVNAKLIAYGQEQRLELGTTVTVVLLFQDGDYFIGHVGDTRAYHVGMHLEQLTEDHTFVAREVQKGRMTPEQAQNDSRRNVLLQCIGVNEFFEMQFLQGSIGQGEAMLLCSDGFRHKITADEIYVELKPESIQNENDIRRKLQKLIQLNKQRQETDNISAVYIKLK